MAVTINGTTGIDKVQDGTIVTADIADSNITTAKIAADAVTASKLNVGQLSHRNLIINGAMQVAQRGTSYTYSSGNAIYTTVDRFTQAYYGSWGSNHSEITQETDAPDGFIYSQKIKALLSQDYSSVLGSWIQYSFENQDIQALQNGNGVKDFTVSLWLKSNKTGNVTISVEGQSYSYSTYVSISSAATWEYKTVTFSATTLGVGIDYTGDPTGDDFRLKVGLGSNGSWLVDVDDQWNDKSTNRGVLSPQQTNFQAAINDYLQITGVQLEVGSEATPFEHRSYGDELARCQRYYQVLIDNANGQRAVAAGRANSTSSIEFQLPLTVGMRDITSLPQSNMGTIYLYSGGARVNTSGGVISLNDDYLPGSSYVYLRTTGASVSDDRAYTLGGFETNAHLAVDGEL